MSNLLHQELAARADMSFDQAAVLDAVHRTVTRKRHQRRRFTVAAAGLLVVALTVGAVEIVDQSAQPASPPTHSIIVSAAPAVPVTAAVLAAAVTAIQHRLDDVAGVAVETTPDGSISARGPAWARDRIVDAVSVQGQLSVRPVTALQARTPTATAAPSLPAQPNGSGAQQLWQATAVAAAARNALPCQRVVASADAALPLIACDQRSGSVAVLAPSIVAGAPQAEASKDPTGQQARVLNVTFNPADHTKFQNYTTGHVGAAVAFTIDNQLLSAPTITSPITSAAVTIQRNLTEAQGQEYARELTHPLPVPLHITTVSSIQ